MIKKTEDYSSVFLVFLAFVSAFSAFCFVSECTSAFSDFPVGYPTSFLTLTFESFFCSSFKTFTGILLTDFDFRGLLLP